MNTIFFVDLYSLLLQSNIIAVLQECTYIILVNESDQFYQFLVKQKYRNRFIIISHRDKEVFNVALRRFKNSISYVQSKMNKFLRSYKFFARYYIDNIIIFSYNLKEYLIQLITIFDLFAKLHVFLKLKKFYIEYSSMTFLNQRVDELDLFTFEKKLIVIRELRFLRSLENLKIYLEIFNWFRIKIIYYAQIAQLLQISKSSFWKSRRLMIIESKHSTIETSSYCQRRAKKKVFRCFKKFLSRSHICIIIIIMKEFILTSTIRKSTISRFISIISKKISTIASSIS